MKGFLLPVCVHTVTSAARMGVLCLDVYVFPKFLVRFVIVAARTYRESDCPDLRKDEREGMRARRRPRHPRIAFTDSCAESLPRTTRTKRGIHRTG